MSTYISLFSSAGVGCYGFKKAGFECVATNEYIERRLKVQRYNHKCKYESGYICGDITLEETKQKLRDQIDYWRLHEHLKRIDVVIATPPCQGMSVANHKKKETEIIRNSLVVESIKLIKEIQPCFFVFENVPAFMKTVCTDVDGIDKPILEAIESNLGKNYSYAYRVLNFKNYGSNSSRQRTLVIGVAKDLEDEISPYELFPDYVKEPTLREVIGDLPALNTMGEICPTDIYHAFRNYPEHMRCWISDIKEGQSAFDNEEDEKKPHQIINGKIVINTNKNGDKYTRQYWDKVGPCIHTRNDQLASQSTIHPVDDRVFSIRELMKLMTVPDDFCWTGSSIEELNALSNDEKKAYLKKDEIKIRQSLGEAVPTNIFFQIASKIKAVLSSPHLKSAVINKLIKDNNFSNIDILIGFIQNNPMGLSLTTLSRIAELSNSNRTENNAFYTNRALITEMVKLMPDFDKDSIRIMEPSVGVGNFIPLIVKKYEGKNLIFDLVDIDGDSIRVTKALLEKYRFPKNVRINYINDDFLLHSFSKKYDLIVGNPPFGKVKSTDKKLEEYKASAINKGTNNICSFFLDKIQSLGGYVALVFPKFILNTPEFKASRDYLQKMHFDAIIDFGEKGFPGVHIETIAFFVNTKRKPGKTTIISMPRKVELVQKQQYIFDSKLPYWLIYRDEEFDDVLSKLELDVFDAVRDRQITNEMLDGTDKDIRVLKARNISDDGTEILNIPDYDSYMSNEKALTVSMYDYLNTDNVYITPNMTYYPRVMLKPKNTLVNGSIALLIPKKLFIMSEEQRAYFSSAEYRRFYQVARNYQTRSLNVDSCSVYFFGLLKAI